MMVSAHEYLVKYSKYKEDYYADNNKLFCKYSSHIVNHERKSVTDGHLRTQTHVNKKQVSVRVSRKLLHKKLII